MQSKKIYLVVGVKGFQAYSTHVIAHGLKEQMQIHGWTVCQVGIEPGFKCSGFFRFFLELIYRYLILPWFARKSIPAKSLVYVVDHADSTVIRWLKQCTVCLHLHDLTSLRPPWDYPYKHTFKSFLIFVLSYLFKRPGIRRADKIVAISHFTSDEIRRYLSIAAEKIEVVHNGVQIPAVTDNDVAIKAKLKLNPGLKVMTSVGPATLRKNYLLIAHAFGRLDPSWCWLHIGDLDRHTKKYLSDNNLIDRLRILEFVENIGDAYLISSVLVHASHYEGFGLPVVEAMLMGIPTVSIDKTVSREIYGKHTIYYSSAQELAQILASEEYLSIDTSAAASHAAQYSWSNAGKKINCILDELIKSRSP